MRFAPTEQQEQFASNIASILEKECSVEALQSAVKILRVHLMACGKHFLKQTLGIGIPEEFGGLGMGALTLFYFEELEFQPVLNLWLNMQQSHHL